MTTASHEDFTGLLLAWTAGDRAALDKLIPAVYQELHRLARRAMARERPGHSLQTTALVHEAYLRLIDSSRVRWHDRAHFFAVSAQMMRRVLVDFARSRQYQKRGGKARVVNLDQAVLVSRKREADLVALDEALSQLALLDTRKSRVVELRFFSGLSVQETAEVLEISPRTVLREWSLAQAWLNRELDQEKRNEA
jgi:RNA polymerase sigma-70 factor, ECF subfamily